MRQLVEQYRWMWGSTRRWYPGNVVFQSAVFAGFVLRDLGSAGSQRVLAMCVVLLAAFVVASGVEQNVQEQIDRSAWNLSGSIASVSVSIELTNANVGRLASDLIALGVREVEFKVQQGDI